MIKCELCNKEYKTIRGLSSHINKLHKEITQQYYYDMFINNSLSKYVCPTCGKPTKFISIGYGYKKHCNQICANKDTEIIRISVTNANATTAAKVANEVEKVFSQRVSEIYKINNVQVVDEAEVSTSPSNINHAKDVMIFAFAGIVVAAMYVLIGNMLDTTIKSAEEVEKEFKVPVLASIPLYNIEPAKKGGKKK